MNSDNKIILHSSRDGYLRSPGKTIQQSHLIGWVQDNGLIFIEKNRFNGVIGVCTRQNWEKLVEQTKKFFKIPDDITTMSRDQLISEVMRLRDRVEKLEK
jgi:hypothetical protein